jgi:hypothetical protein
MSVINEIRQALMAEKAYKEGVFYPPDTTIQPFQKQIDFFKDNSRTKLIRAGNRSAKSFTNSRDLAWRIMKKHPYIPEENCSDAEYINSKPKIRWFAAPDLQFIHDTVWKQYLEVFIPSWYYINDDLVPMIRYEKDRGKDIIHSVTFRNGDVLLFRSYTQNLLSKMGQAVDDVFLDEAPNDMRVITELVVRVLDKGGLMSSAWTPVDIPQELIDYVENHPLMSQHRWSMMDNPVFRDDPEKLERAMAEFSNLPEQQRNMRIHGDWINTFSEEDRVWSNVYPIEVDDFPIPHNWRQVRVADPAGHRTGFAIFAEDPETNDWYCYLAEEIEWKGRTARADDIEARMDTHAPFADFRYFASVYDNAENWFAAHANHKHGQWQPCIAKNVELFTSLTRNAISTGKVKFFKVGGRLASQQFLSARRNEKTGKPMFKRLHSVDCVRIFCANIPERDENWVGDKRTELEWMVDEDWKVTEKAWAAMEKTELIEKYKTRNRR